MHHRSIIRSIHSDHLNSVRILRCAQRLKSVPREVESSPAKSWYLWAIHLLLELDNVSIEHTYGHVDGDSLPSRLKTAADAAAADAHKSPITIHPPRFFMREYSLLDNHGGFVENGLRKVIFERMAVASLRKMSPTLRDRVAPGVSSGYCVLPPPSFPWKTWKKSFSLVTVLSNKLSNLGLGDVCARVFKDGRDDTCLFCPWLEETRAHTFVDCAQHNEIRHKATAAVLEKTKGHLDKWCPDGQTSPGGIFLLEMATSLFVDGPLWPSGSTQYDVGLLPDLVSWFHVVDPPETPDASRLLYNVAREWYIAGLLLTGLIWSRRMAEFFRLKEAKENAARAAQRVEERRLRPPRNTGP